MIDQRVFFVLILLHFPPGAEATYGQSLTLPGLLNSSNNTEFWTLTVTPDLRAERVRIHVTVTAHPLVAAC